MLKDKRFSRCLKKPFLTDACDLESTILSASPNLLEMAVAVLLGKKTLDEQCRFNVNKALMLSYESGLVRISEDATTNDDFGTDSVAIYYREVIDYQYSYPFFDFEGGTFLLEKWLALVVEKAKISNGKNRWGYQYDADFWSASFKDFLNERGAIIEDSNHRCVWNQPFLEKQMSKGFSRGAEGCQQFWRFVNGHMLAYFIGKTTKNNLIKCDKLKKYKYGEWTLEDSIADTFKENSQFIKEFVDQTQVAHQIRDALKSLPYICI